MLVLWHLYDTSAKSLWDEQRCQVAKGMQLQQVGKLLRYQRVCACPGRLRWPGWPPFQSTTSPWKKHLLRSAIISAKDQKSKQCIASRIVRLSIFIEIRKEFSHVFVCRLNVCVGHSTSSAVGFKVLHCVMILQQRWIFDPKCSHLLMSRKLLPNRRGASVFALCHSRRFCATSLDVFELPRWRSAAQKRCSLWPPWTFCRGWRFENSTGQRCESVPLVSVCWDTPPAHVSIANLKPRNDWRNCSRKLLWPVPKLLSMQEGIALL